MCLYKDKLEGYGPITQKRANTKVGHYFWDLTVAKLVDIELIYRHKMKVMFSMFTANARLAPLVLIWPFSS